MKWKELWREAKVTWRQLSMKSQLKIFPIREDFVHYNRVKAKGDVKAALNVALMALPQGMAYALVAGLPVQYGIYCAAIAAFVGPWFASSRFTILGPSNATAILVLSAFILDPTGGTKLASLSLLVLLVGALLIIAAFLHVPTLIQYVSRSVVIGYMTGAALLIIANQLHHCLGFSVGEAATFFDVWESTFRGLDETRWQDLSLALFALGIYEGARKHYTRWPAAAMTLGLCTVIAQFMEKAGAEGRFLAPLSFASWPLSWPAWSLNSFYGLADEAFALALFAILEGTFTSKSLASRTNRTVDVNQDTLSMGIANVTCAFFSGMPASTSPVRSQLNYESGAKTSLASIWSGLICAVAVFFAGPIIGFVPLSALAVCVIRVAWGLVDWRRIRIALRATRSDGLVLIVTFLATLLTPLDFAIFLGTAVSIVLYLRKAATPQLVEYTFNEEGNLCEVDALGKRVNPQISIIHVEGELFFGASDLFRNEIRRVATDEDLKVIILRLKNARHLDATSVMALEELILFLRGRGCHLLISGAMRDVIRVLKSSGLFHLLGAENIFPGSTQNPNVSTRNALKRAQELIGTQKADVRIFYETNKASDTDI
jgi:SulP family sulfate permease